MDKILDFLQKNTAGKCYQSFQYCLDDAQMPGVNPEENDDERIISVKRSGETDKRLRTSKPLESLARKISTEHRPLFRFFLDSSRRTYKVDDIAFGEKVYPVIAGQVGVGCCERSSASTFKSKVFTHKLILSLPTKANVDGKNTDLFFNNLLKKLNNEDFLKKRGVFISDILPYDNELRQTGDKYEHRGIAKIHDAMVSLEKETVVQLTSQKQLGFETYLLKDGSLEYKKMKTDDYKDLSAIQNSYKCVVGVSKSFNPELCKDENGKSNAVNISNLLPLHRTPAYLYDTSYVENVKFSVWYIRIRDSKSTVSPFDGIVKVEKVLISPDELEYGLDSDEIDLISANIINERHPVSYGKDSRWANHLYPVHLTETYVKSQFLSDLHFISLF